MFQKILIYFQFIFHRPFLWYLLQYPCQTDNCLIISTLMFLGRFLWRANPHDECAKSHVLHI